MIIFEGVDASGKSTLAKYCADRIYRRTHRQLAIQGSEGPAKSYGEIHSRVRRYATLQDTLFDRHPIVSQAIYNNVRPSPVWIEPSIMDQFYRQPNLFIYCDGDGGLHDHEIKEDESPDHVMLVQRNYRVLLEAYRSWAVHHAHVVYRIGDDMDVVVTIVAHALDRL